MCARRGYCALRVMVVNVCLAGMLCFKDHGVDVCSVGDVAF